VGALPRRQQAPGRRRAARPGGHAGPAGGGELHARRSKRRRPSARSARRTPSTRRMRAPKDLPAGVTLLSHDSVMVEFETCRFVFSDLEKSGRELHAEMEVQNAAPGHAPGALHQRSTCSRCRPAMRAAARSSTSWATPPKGQWTALLSRRHEGAGRLPERRSVGQDQRDRGARRAGVRRPRLWWPTTASRSCSAPAARQDLPADEGGAGVSRGDSFLGRSTQARNVLYIDCETGRKTFGYRMRRICAGEGLGPRCGRQRPLLVGGGIPLEDQVDAIKRCCEQNEIGFVCLDHIAAACGGDATEQSVASRIRPRGRQDRPADAGARAHHGRRRQDPEQARKPFGSIFWENNARRTIFVLRQQEDESPVADLGLYPRKVNDGGRPSPFGATDHLRRPVRPDHHRPRDDEEVPL
jgi:hypothetical protein